MTPVDLAGNCALVWKKIVHNMIMPLRSCNLAARLQGTLMFLSLANCVFEFVNMTWVYEQMLIYLCRSFLDLGAGLSVGLSGLAAGFAIGIVGDAGVRGSAQQPRLFVGMILILIFAEVLGLYGLIVALILHTKS